LHCATLNIVPIFKSIISVKEKLKTYCFTHSKCLSNFSNLGTYNTTGTNHACHHGKVKHTGPPPNCNNKRVRESNAHNRGFREQASRHYLAIKPLRVFFPQVMDI